jgi:uroporphyrinogen III methyltransferase/synthase
MPDECANGGIGKVYLVGAGPGDPGLLTLRGADCLHIADVVLYDYLVNPAILSHARQSAEIICLGRHGRDTMWSQESINRRLVEEARAGKIVVRLKSGDPMIFGRAADELDSLVEAGIPFEIVPGITAALAAGGCAGIPVTHRDLASAVALVTGQEGSDKGEVAIDYQALANFPGTIVVYMGVTTASHWSSELIRGGKPADTPVAVIRRCSWPNQQVLHCRLDEVADRLTPYHKFPPPAIAIVGPVTRLSHTLSWFERRPLFGQTILITRPADQASDLEQRLAELGAGTIVSPVIEISDPALWQPVDDALRRIAEFDWIVFSSVNGVRQFMERLLFQGRDARSMSNTRIAAIGPATAESLLRYGIRADLQPTAFRAEALADMLIPTARGQRFVLVRASRGRDLLSDELHKAGGVVEQIVVYTSRDRSTPDTVVVEKLQEGSIHWVTVTSSAIAGSLAKLYGELLRRTKLASISPVTSAVLRQLGFEPAIEANIHTMQGLVDAMVQAVKSESA